MNRNNFLSTTTPLGFFIAPLPVRWTTCLSKASGTFDFTGGSIGVGTLVNSYNATAELKYKDDGNVDPTNTFHMGDFTFYQIDVTFDSQLHDANYQVFVTESHTS